MSEATTSVDACGASPIASRPGGRFFSMGAGFLGFVFALSQVMPLVVTSAPPDLAPILGGISLAAGMLCLAGPIVVLATRSTLKIGRDGVQIRWLGRTRFVPFAEVDQMRADAQRITIRLRTGRVVHVELVGTDARFPLDPRGTEALAAIERGVALARAEREALPLEDELARGTRSAGAWLSGVTARAEEKDDYRSAALDRDQLVRVVEDPVAVPSARAASAELLRRAGLAEGEAIRVRVAIDETANPALRDALEAAIDPAADHAARAKALSRVE